MRAGSVEAGWRGLALAGAALMAGGVALPWIVATDPEGERLGPGWALTAGWVMVALAALAALAPFLPRRRRARVAATMACGLVALVHVFAFMSALEGPLWELTLSMMQVEIAFGPGVYVSMAGGALALGAGTWALLAAPPTETPPGMHFAGEPPP